MTEKHETQAAGGLAIIRQLAGEQRRHPGGHNWPDLELVYDPSLTEIEDGAVYLVTIAHGMRGEYIAKKLRRQGGSIRCEPALATIHDAYTVEVFGKTLPCQKIEFTDSYPAWQVEVHGRVVGLFAP